MQPASGAVARHGFFRIVAATICGLAFGLLTGCATHYVDGATKDVPASQFRQPASPAPVQLLFSFETKGVENARATEFLKKAVTEQVAASGLFSTVDDKPVPSGAMLDVKLNNVPLSDDAFSKGFVTGLTFGLAGSQVSDGYICTVRYLPAGREPIIKTARHAIHTTMGAAKSPGDSKQMKNITEAVTAMTHEILSTVLNDLSHDPAFK